MRIVEERVSSGSNKLFDLEEFLGRPLFAHLATLSAHGPRHSPVWFHWDGSHIWIIGGTTFPQNIAREPRCAVGIIDFNRTNGLVHHVGMRGTAVVLPFNAEIIQLIYGKYFGEAKEDWDKRFEASWNGDEPVELVRFEPETVVIRDQSYHTSTNVCYEK